MLRLPVILSSPYHSVAPTGPRIYDSSPHVQVSYLTWYVVLDTELDDTHPPEKPVEKLQHSLVETMITCYPSQNYFTTWYRFGEGASGVTEGWGTELHSIV